MKFCHYSHRLLAVSFLFAAFVATAPRASAQSLYTATQQYSLSAWGGATGTFVNLPAANSGVSTPVVVVVGSLNTLFTGGRNIGISAGVDLRVWHYHHFLPSVEIRGTLPVSSGGVAGEENVLGGGKVEYPFGRFHPYGDFLFGRGEIKYQGIGYISPDSPLIYQQSFSNVLSPGVGVDIDVTHHFAAKLDAQLWRSMSVPVTTTGKLDSLALTAGVIYRFDFNHPPKIPRDTRPR